MSEGKSTFVSYQYSGFSTKEGRIYQSFGNVVFSGRSPKNMKEIEEWEDNTRAELMEKMDLSGITCSILFFREMG